MLLVYNFATSRKVLIDMLPLVGTYPSVHAVLERLQKKEISEDSEAVILMTLGLLPDPDVFMVTKLKVWKLMPI